MSIKIICPKCKKIISMDFVRCPHCGFVFKPLFMDTEGTLNTEREEKR